MFILNWNTVSEKPEDVESSSLVKMHFRFFLTFLSAVKNFA